MIDVKINKHTDEAEYPCLMISKGGQIVLFKEPKIGTVIVSTMRVYSVGGYSERWNMDEFKPFNHELVLKNN